MTINLSDLYPWGSSWNPVPAVYVILNASQAVIYVGQTDDLKRRMDEHRRNSYHAMHRFHPVYVYVEIISNEAARRSRERQLIERYMPPCNHC